MNTWSPRGRGTNGTRSVAALLLLALLAACGDDDGTAAASGDDQGSSASEAPDTPGTSETPAAPEPWAAPAEPRIRPAFKLEKEPTYVYAVEFAPDGTQFASGDAGGKVTLWDTSGNEIETLEGHDGAAVNDLAFSPDGTKLATASDDSTARIFDLDTGESIVLEGAEDAVRSVSWAPDGQTIATASWDEVGTRVYSVDGSLVEELQSDGSIETVGFTPDGSTLVVGGSNGFLETWSTGDWSRGDVVEGGGASPNEFVFSSDGHTMYAATNDSTVQVWTVAGLVKGEKLGDYLNYVRGVALSPDGTLLASGALNGAVRIHSTDGYEVVLDESNYGGVNDVVFSPSEPLLVTTDGEGITGYVVE